MPKTDLHIHMSASKPVYPSGFPLYWRDERKNIQLAMEAYLSFCCGDGPEPSKQQMDSVIWYLNYHIAAPCWDENPEHDDASRAELAELRKRASELASVESCRRYIEEAMDLGLDPL